MTKSCLKCVHSKSEDGVIFCWRMKRVISDSYGEGDDTPCDNHEELAMSWLRDIDTDPLPF